MRHGAAGILVDGSLEDVLPGINKIIIQGGATRDVVPLLQLNTGTVGAGAAAAVVTEQTK